MVPQAAGQRRQGNGRMHTGARDVGDVIAVDRIGTRQVVLLAVGVLILLSDGFDAQVMSVAGPGIAAAWAVPRQALGPVFASNLAGLMIGALLITPLADTFSRKRIIGGCILAFGLLSLLTLATTTLLQLDVLRFLTGLALGAAMPSVIAACSEYVPERLRTRIVVGLSCAFSLGSALSGTVASILMPRHGWAAMFWVGGLLPLLSLPLLVLLFPESPTFLVSRGRTEELRSLLRRIGPTVQYRPGQAAIASARGFPVSELFRSGRTAITLSLWLTYFCSGATLYFLVNWLPTLVSHAGYGTDVSALSITAYSIGGITGGFIVSVFIDRFGAVALSLWLFAAALGVAVVGHATSSELTILLAAGLAGLLVVGGQNAMNAFTGSRLYPSAIRATGLGWALAVLRLGGVLAGSLAAGVVIGLDLGPSNTFMVIGAPELLCGLGILLIHLRRATVVVDRPLTEEVA